MGYHLTIADAVDPRETGPVDPVTKYTVCHPKTAWGPIFIWVLSTKYTDDEAGLVYYGYRFYQSESGRWVGRDPIGEWGGVYQYAFADNEPMVTVDYLGLAPAKVNVIDKGQKLEDLVPEFHPKDYFRADRFWERLEAVVVPRDKRDPMLVGGVTSYDSPKPKVECTCTDPRQSSSSSGSQSGSRETRQTSHNSKGSCCFVTCTVTWRAKVELNQDWNHGSWQQDGSIRGAWGHEQRHVVVMKDKIQRSVITPLSRRVGEFNTPIECQRAAADYQSFYSSSLFTVIQTGESHADSNPEAPARGKMYPPLPNTPPLVFPN